MERKSPQNDEKSKSDEELDDRDVPEIDEAVYGDTDMNPNADDQRDAHHGTSDDVV